MEAKNEPSWAKGATWPWTSGRQNYCIKTLPINKSSCLQGKEDSRSTDSIIVLCSWPQIYFLEPVCHTFLTFPILLSKLRSDEQGQGSCRQTELAKILSHNTALHSSNIPQVHALGQRRSGERKINNDDKNSPWLDKTNINWVRGQELPVTDLGVHCVLH